MINIEYREAAFTPDSITAFMTTTANGATFSKKIHGSEQYYEQVLADYKLNNIVTLSQVHTSDILEVSKTNISEIQGRCGDGLFTTDKDLALGILTADCYPVLLAGEQGIAALHCGWKGAVNGIIHKAAEMFRKYNDPAKYALVGAGISAESFEVKDDFVKTVAHISPYRYLSQKNGKQYFDLKQYIVDCLIDENISEIQTLKGCTYKEPEFHSYRRDGENSGRMLSVICRRG